MRVIPTVKLIWPEVKTPRRLVGSLASALARWVNGESSAACNRLFCVTTRLRQHRDQVVLTQWCLVRVEVLEAMRWEAPSPGSQVRLIVEGDVDSFATFFYASHEGCAWITLNGRLHAIRSGRATAKGRVQREWWVFSRVDGMILGAFLVDRLLLSGETKPNRVLMGVTRWTIRL